MIALNLRFVNLVLDGMMSIDECLILLTNLKSSLIDQNLFPKSIETSPTTSR